MGGKYGTCADVPLIEGVRLMRGSLKVGVNVNLNGI